MTIKLKWRVQPEPTGRYRSFDHRGWPSADYPNGQGAASIHCEDDYSAKRAKGELPHTELSVWIAFHHPKSEWPLKGGFTWRTLKARFAILAQAKEAAQAFIDSHPEVHPYEEHTQVASNTEAADSQIEDTKRVKG